MLIRFSHPASGAAIAGGRDLYDWAQGRGFSVLFDERSRRVTIGVLKQGGNKLLLNAEGAHPYKVGSITPPPGFPHFGPITVDAVIGTQGFTFTLPKELPPMNARKPSVRGKHTESAPLPVDNRVTVLIEIDNETISYKVPKTVAIKVAALCENAESASKNA